MRRVVGIPQLGAIRIVRHGMERQRLNGLSAGGMQIGVLHPGDVEEQKVTLPTVRQRRGSGGKLEPHRVAGGDEYRLIVGLAQQRQHVAATSEMAANRAPW